MPVPAFTNFRLYHRPNAGVKNIVLGKLRSFSDFPLSSDPLWARMGFMKTRHALTLMDLIIAVVLAVVLTAVVFLIGRWNRDRTPFREHITGFHGIDCTANAATRRRCRDLGVAQ